MRNISRFLFLIIVSLTFFAGIQHVEAKGKNEVSQEAVLAACRHTSGCNYDTDTWTGDAAGCSEHACFYCTGGKCHQTGPGTGGHAIKPQQPGLHIATNAWDHISQNAFGSGSGGGGSNGGGSGPKTVSSSVNTSNIHISNSFH